MGHVTQLLKRMAAGDRQAHDDLYPLIYKELRRLAGISMSRERPNHSLDATALLHEAYIKLAEAEDTDWESRGHFYAMAVRIMRRILITHARARNAGKRGGNAVRIDLNSNPGAAWSEPQELLVDLDSALTRLETYSPRAYKVVELKFFAGLSFDEASLALGVTPRTLKRDWETAKAWLYRELESSQSGGRRGV